MHIYCRVSVERILKIGQCSKKLGGLIFLDHPVCINLSTVLLHKTHCLVQRKQVCCVASLSKDAT